jgi:hypothetical protein
MANKQSKYLHFKVYDKFCLRIKDICANFKTNTIQHNEKGQYYYMHSSHCFL